MVFAIISIIIGVIIGIVASYDEWGDYEHCWVDGIVGALIGLVIWFFVGGIIGANLQTVETVSTEGANYLFSGYINENLVYRYVINTDRGKHIEELSSENVYINEGDYKPTVKTYTTCFKEDWYYLFVHDKFVSESYVVFFVPENTVTNEYSIDLD